MLKWSQEPLLAFMQVKRLTGPDAVCVVIYDKPSEKRKVGGSTPPLTT
jgi:hypothetical protein